MAHFKVKEITSGKGVNLNSDGVLLCLQLKCLPNDITQNCVVSEKI